MGHLDHAVFGRPAPGLSHVMACTGAAAGRRCTARGPGTIRRARRNGPLTATRAIATGSWTTQVVAMPGFAAGGTAIRYDITAPRAAAVASPPMGAALSSVHPPGKPAAGVRVTPSGTPLPGATAMQFVFPLAVGLGPSLYLTSAFVALSPTAGESSATAPAPWPAGSPAR
ncbi:MULTISPECIES: hypothetical protein [unclassified Streptomyces]|uniref:hypothetical protein n=1 Tax=unclassified Streptomyces TaxID=2593676 RepID=UPI001F041DAA|nr:MULTISPECIES: hypothetical protein [unclassified Streptomyces]MCH0562456.1 hypothetical protein [Streptomyces sp. MUM 2J]MCH0570432.1 hypothetical protein [Streptomyces sp. MUM 136J]